MNKRDFIKKRRPLWDRFEALNVRSSSRSKLKAKEINEFSRLLRLVSHDLATIRARSWGAGLISYLNNLVTRGHSRFYSAPPARMRDLLLFVTTGFPRLVRANWRYFVIAWLLFFVPMGVSWALVQTNPALANRIIPEEQLTMFDEMYESNPKSDRERERDASGLSELDQRNFMAGFYVLNNTSIAFYCFARGILLGVGTVYTLLANGIVIGAVAGYMIALGHSEKFLSFVATHGSFELTAIAVAGAAGLVLGDSLIHPGRRSRLESLRVRGMDAIKLAAGAGLMLFVAALIEGFWSPSSMIGPQVKYVVGAVLWVAVYLYFALAGRGRATQ